MPRAENEHPLPQFAISNSREVTRGSMESARTQAALHTTIDGKLRTRNKVNSNERRDSMVKTWVGPRTKFQGIVELGES